MVTSSSSERAGGWRAGASLFSGRPDPSWEVDTDAAARLVRQVEQLPPADDLEFPVPPPLGYRGAWLRAPDGREWLGYEGLVVSSGRIGRGRWLDPERRLEQEILDTAPAGLLPPGLIQKGGRL